MNPLYGALFLNISYLCFRWFAMQFHWLRDRVQLKEFIVIWRKGIYNLADFFTKPLSVKDHQSVMHLLVRVPTSSPALHSKRVLRSRRWRESQ